jgi:hypothetical protein
MEERNVTPDGLQGYIKLGRMIDFDKPWDEIERIANTFNRGD